MHRLRAIASCNDVPGNFDVVILLKLLLPKECGYIVHNMLVRCFVVCTGECCTLKFMLSVSATVYTRLPWAVHTRAGSETTVVLS